MDLFTKGEVPVEDAKTADTDHLMARYEYLEFTDDQFAKEHEDLRKEISRVRDLYMKERGKYPCIHAKMSLSRQHEWLQEIEHEHTHLLRREFMMKRDRSELAKEFVAITDELKHRRQQELI